MDNGHVSSHGMVPRLGSQKVLTTSITFHYYDNNVCHYILRNFQIDDYGEQIRFSWSGSPFTKSFVSILDQRNLVLTCILKLYFFSFLLPWLERTLQESAKCIILISFIFGEEPTYVRENIILWSIIPRTNMNMVLKLKWQTNKRISCK